MGLPFQWNKVNFSHVSVTMITNSKSGKSDLVTSSYGCRNNSSPIRLLAPEADVEKVPPSLSGQLFLRPLAGRCSSHHPLCPPQLLCISQAHRRDGASERTSTFHGESNWQWGHNTHNLPPRPVVSPNWVFRKGPANYKIRDQWNLLIALRSRRKRMEDKILQKATDHQHFHWAVWGTYPSISLLSRKLPSPTLAAKQDFFNLTELKDPR